MVYLGDDIERRPFELSLYNVAVVIGASGQFFNAVNANGFQAASTSSFTEAAPTSESSDATGVEERPGPLIVGHAPLSEDCQF